MATRAQIITARASAGADYAAAAQALVDAWVALSAYDGAVEATGGGPKPQPSFNDISALGSLPMHPVYLPQSAQQAMTSPNIVAPAVASSAKTIITSWSGN